MSEAWDRRNVLEAEAEKLRAEAELERTQPAFMELAIKTEESRREEKQEERQDRYRDQCYQMEKRRALAGQKTAEALGRLVGPNAVLHGIWASVVIVVTYIITVWGWRG